MIHWKSKKEFKNNAWFEEIKDIRSEMIDAIMEFNKEQKIFRGEFATKKYWKPKTTDAILLALNELLNNKK